MTEDNGAKRKSKEELIAIREAQKRLTWIENVKRIKGWGQEKAESEWTKIFNQHGKQ
jgi:site-specific DNA-cytosine methylase